MSSRLLFSLLLASALVGCNWTQILAFRSQMRAITEFTAWEGNENATFVFKQPLLTIRDLNDFDVYPEMLDERNAVLRYHRVNAPPGTAVDYEIRLLFVEGKLAGLIFPPPLRDGLGKGNIVGFFAMMGGGDFPPGVGLRAFPKSQLVAANLFPKAMEPLGREAMVLLIPADSRNRPIDIKMTEREKQPGYYSECLISFKRRTEASWTR
ncbi:hypothetical protein [Opitutus sp. GAS368]|uniref:hypothetical protein n=1 Tax=Opitutus sp. GAS368 TaxID=1882749 RepID=UPI000879F9D4|nr:hypothetical protein [Opitutus sp. GAS368]SDR82793.1 hypothetical protein SAMN05444173_1030 [Opitutus sp. GAS368]